MNPSVLVAGVGNIFLSDDGFGVEVAQRLALKQLPDCVQVKDFGIRGVHLAFELLDGCDTLILVDASPRGEAPGTVYVIEPELQSAREHASDEARSSPLVDGHGMEPDSVLALLDSLGGKAGRVLVLGCEPASLEEGIGLSPPVSQAIDKAVDLVTELINEELKGAALRPAGLTIFREGREEGLDNAQGRSVWIRFGAGRSGFPAAAGDPPLPKDQGYVMHDRTRHRERGTRICTSSACARGSGGGGTARRRATREPDHRSRRGASPSRRTCL